MCCEHWFLSAWGWVCFALLVAISGLSWLVMMSALGVWLSCMRDVLLEGEGQRMYIGMVEDEQAIAEMVVIMLQFEGHRVRAYGSGHAFLRALSSGERYDVLLLDVSLPGGISGLDILRALVERHVQLPVLILTAAECDLAQIHDIYPVVDLLRKPFRRVTLLARLERLAKQGKQREEQ